MNNIATAAAALLLAAGAGFVAWRTGALGTQYARVVQTTPVFVVEPRYVDVERAVPVPGGPSYDVSYRVDGRLQRQRLPADPGDQLRVGEQRRVIGYDVEWRWRDRGGVVRMSQPPGKRLPVVDGAVVEARRFGQAPG